MKDRRDDIDDIDTRLCQKRRIDLMHGHSVFAGDSDPRGWPADLVLLIRSELLTNPDIALALAADPHKSYFTRIWKMVNDIVMPLLYPPGNIPPCILPLLKVAPSLMDDATLCVMIKPMIAMAMHEIRQEVPDHSTMCLAFRYLTTILNRYRHIPNWLDVLPWWDVIIANINRYVNFTDHSTCARAATLYIDAWALSTLNWYQVDPDVTEKKLATITCIPELVKSHTRSIWVLKTLYGHRGRPVVELVPYVSTLMDNPLGEIWLADISRDEPLIRQALVEAPTFTAYMSSLLGTIGSVRWIEQTTRYSDLLDYAYAKIRACRCIRLLLLQRRRSDQCHPLTNVPIDMMRLIFKWSFRPPLWDIPLPALTIVSRYLHESS